MSPKTSSELVEELTNFDRRRAYHCVWGSSTQDNTRSKDMNYSTS